MEFFTLLTVSLMISITVTIIVILAFNKSIQAIFLRIIGEDIAKTWQKFLTFALFVVGISSGVSVRKFERFIEPVSDKSPRIELTPESWGLEIFRTVLNTLGGLAWALLVFFLVALITFVIVKGREKVMGEQE